MIARRFIVLSLFHPAILFGQTSGKIVDKLKKLPNADAKGAIEITDSIAGPFNISLGYGVSQEFKQREIWESNSAWFKFTVDHDTTLTFDIVPIDSVDDYDFVLFKCLDGSCIDKNGKMNLVKIRHCFSICASKSGMTGLSNYVKATEIGDGLGPAYVASVQVKANETYYLMVDCASRYLNQIKQPLGFRIYFYNYYPRKAPVVLNNVLFETNKSILKSESFKELDKLALLLKKSYVIIEIRGHTDNIGGITKNQVLSEERAKAVVDYLVSQKINPKRLFYKGLGSTTPVASNATEEGREKNRRVEFVVLLK